MRVGTAEEGETLQMDTDPFLDLVVYHSIIFGLATGLDLQNRHTRNKTREDIESSCWEDVAQNEHTSPDRELVFNRD